MWDNLDCDNFGLRTRFVNHVVYLPAAYIGEALACCVDRGRTAAVGGLVCGKRASRDRDQAGTRMRVPASVSPGWPRVLDHVDV